MSQNFSRCAEPRRVVNLIVKSPQNSRLLDTRRNIGVSYSFEFIPLVPGRVAQSVGQRSLVRYPVWPHTFVSPSADSRRAAVSYWRMYVHKVLVNRLGGLSLHWKIVARLTDRPDTTLDVYRGRKTTTQQYTPLVLHLDMIGMMNWIESLEYRRLKKGQDNQGQNQSLGYLYDIELYEGFA